ncbi:DUF2460 domain-containing protein [Mesorhizobium sp. M0217]|uniref:DUF2460 domain-containing protein n=1 Tax=unclassified Mesorhizobium TaxID=325217 RepID=UPI00333D6649
MTDTVAINNKFALDMTMGPVFQTTVIPLMGGYEDRNQDWTVALWRYDVKLNNRPLSEIRAFIGHVLGRRGAANAFPLRDPLDNTLTDENIGTGNGTTKVFRIYKTYPDADRPYRRPLAVVQNLVVKVDGVAQDEGTDYQQESGYIGFVSAPTAGQAITVTCDWLVRVRYQADYNPISLPIGPDTGTPFASAGPFTLMEVSGPAPAFAVPPPDPWITVAQAELDADSPGWGGYTIRQVIGGIALTPNSGSQCRVTFDASSMGDLTIGEAWIGKQASSGDAYDFVSPVQLMFSGNPGVTIAQGSQLVSDAASFPLGGVDLEAVVIAIYFTGSSATREVSSTTGWSSYFKIGNGAGTENASAYGPWSASAICVSKVDRAA